MKSMALVLLLLAAVAHGRVDTEFAPPLLLISNQGIFDNGEWQQSPESVGLENKIEAIEQKLSDPLMVVIQHDDLTQNNMADALSELGNGNHMPKDGQFQYI